MASSSLQTRWWLEEIKVEVVQLQHLVEGLVLEVVEEMLEVLWMLQCANVRR